MKEITKKVETTIYVAEDGKEFDNKRDCRFYEMENDLTHFRIADENGNKTNDMDDAIYFYSKSKNGMEEFMMLNILCSYCIKGLSIERPGLYFWNGKEWKFYDDYIEMEIKKLNEQRKDLITLLSK